MVKWNADAKEFNPGRECRDLDAQETRVESSQPIQVEAEEDEEDAIMEHQERNLLPDTVKDFDVEAYFD